MSATTLASGADVARWMCSSCRSYAACDTVRYDCPRCGGRFELAPAAGVEPRPRDEYRSLWRYADLLPVEPAGDTRIAGFAQRFPAGGTPLTDAPALARHFGLAGLSIKDETRNPTRSLKDRASAMVVASALQLGQDVLATASTGNAAQALAAATRCAGLRCVVFVPRTIAPLRVQRLEASGAEVVVVDGDYDEANRLCAEACAEWSWYARTTALNPYTTQGKKTVGLEIAEQCGGRAPDAVVVPVGDGNILVGLHLGLRDAVRVGWLDRMPQLFGVQARGASAVHDAWLAGHGDVAAAPAATVASGISVGLPMDGRRALRAVRSSRGAMVLATDADILAAQRCLADAGVATETASAAGFAGTAELRARGYLTADSTVVVVNTGAGDPTGTAPPLPVGRAVVPTLAGVTEALAR